MDMAIRFGKRDVPVYALRRPDEPRGAVRSYRRRHLISVRITWRQVALWHNYDPIINWLNPLMWCRHGNGLHFRGKPIEVYRPEE